MGWAKYYEDNISIYIGRMAVREVSPVFYERPETVKGPVVKAAATEEKKKDIVAENSEMTQILKLSEKKWKEAELLIITAE